MQELRSSTAQVLPGPIAEPPAVAADIAEPPAVAAESVTPDTETFEAMRWASKLTDDGSVLALIHALPKKVVEEQVLLYKQRDQTIVAATTRQPLPQIS